MDTQSKFRFPYLCSKYFTYKPSSSPWASFRLSDDSVCLLSRYRRLKLPEAVLATLGAEETQISWLDELGGRPPGGSTKPRMPVQAGERHLETAQCQVSMGREGLRSRLAPLKVQGPLASLLFFVYLFSNNH